MHQLNQELTLSIEQQQKILNFLGRLINQKAARVIVPAQQDADGYWFGGGNLVLDANGTIWLCGRYRNQGDSRTGLEAGERGLEWLVLRSDDAGQTFSTVKTRNKRDLSRPGREVISIEGSALNQLPDGSWEAFISLEKDIEYPEAVASYRKPGTGVWSIDRMTGPSPDEFDLSTLTTALENNELPGYLHLKDPEVFTLADGSTALIFCSHPFTWASSNTGLALRGPQDTAFTVQTYEMVSRGPSWDVAATRVTDRLVLPPVGLLAELPPVSVYFYDGAEAMRQLEENRQAHQRPRGYSCEEISGVFAGIEDDFSGLQRLSNTQPSFISPYGTGSSRYISTLATEEGILATWQQSQPSGAQPLVANFLTFDEIERLLS